MQSTNDIRRSFLDYFASGKGGAEHAEVPSAPLVPYNTVGFLMAAIMAVSSVDTVILLPSIMMRIQNRLSPKKERLLTSADDAPAPLATNKEQTT